MCFHNSPLYIQRELPKRKFKFCIQWYNYNMEQSTGQMTRFSPFMYVPYVVSISCIFIAASLMLIRSLGN